MIDFLGIADKILSALSISKSASDLSDEVSDDNKQKKADQQERESMEKQRREEMTLARESQGHQESSQSLNQR